MAPLFLPFISQNQVTTDDVGADISLFEAAYLDSCDAALEISIERFAARDDPPMWN